MATEERDETTAGGPEAPPAVPEGTAVEASAPGAEPGGEAAAPAGGPGDTGAPLHFEDRPAWEPDDSSDAFAERPHVFVGAAFAGGFLAAQVLKRLGRG